MGFKSEAQMVHCGRRLIRQALKGLEVSVRTRYEVPAPGGVPDLVIFSKQRSTVLYVVTVEFKLRHWRRALHQAFRHRNYGNEAYVVLDATRATPALQNLDVFRQANVGLMTIDTDSQVDVWHYPEPQLPFSTQFSRSVARTLIAPSRTLPHDPPFIRSVRGGLKLSSLRNLLGSPRLRQGECSDVIRYSPSGRTL